MEKGKKKKKEKIKPNEVYFINRLNFASQGKVLTKICMTLKYAKREPIDPGIFIEYITTSLAIARCVILITFNEEQNLSSCVVTLLKNVPTKGKILWIEWAWSDGKDLSLGKQVLEKLEDMAQILKADRIACAMTRGFKAVLRKYGFKEAYRVIEKEVKKNVEKN